MATFKNAVLQCVMCTFTYTFFSSSCSDEIRNGSSVLQDRTMLVREWFPVRTLPGQWLAWFSMNTGLADRCGKQRNIALMQLPVPSGTEGQQQCPVGTSALFLRALYPCPAITAHVCLHILICWGEITPTFKHGVQNTPASLLLFGA